MSKLVLVVFGLMSVIALVVSEAGFGGGGGGGNSYGAPARPASSGYGAPASSGYGPPASSGYGPPQSSYGPPSGGGCRSRGKGKGFGNIFRGLFKKGGRGKGGGGGGGYGGGGGGYGSGAGGARGLPFGK